MKKVLFILIGSLLVSLKGSAQEDTLNKRLNFSGYLSGMPSEYWIGDIKNKWQVLVHNRLNFDFYLTDKITASVQFRDQLITGDLVGDQNYSDGFKKLNYALPLAYFQTMGDMMLLSLSIDRAWVQYTRKKFEIILGRQRINWCQTFAWNPNDIFNSYNFFDFDYEERPGADAIRVQYYTSNTSSLDLATKWNDQGKITAAGLFHFNRWLCDFQILGGYLQQSNEALVPDTVFRTTQWEDKDLLTGFGFSGAIKNISIRSEMSYFYSTKTNSDSTNKLMVSFTTDYSFSNELYLIFEFCYTDKIIASNTSDLMGLYGGEQNIKSLTYTKYNFFGQASYPIIPIVNAGISGMYLYDSDLQGFFLGPNLAVSIGDNMQLSLFYQYFYLKPANTDLSIHMAFLRYKWNF